MEGRLGSGGIVVIVCFRYQQCLASRLLNGGGFGGGDSDVNVGWVAWIMGRACGLPRCVYIGVHLVEGKRRVKQPWT